MEKLNISKPEKYTTKSGEEKTFWANVGTITIFEKPDGSKSYIVEIPAISLKANAFPAERKDGNRTTGSDDINPEDIF